ncbi:uncharacterized protein V6R79_000458 [Siganus canaliculatus]
MTTARSCSKLLTCRVQDDLSRGGRGGRRRQRRQWNCSSRSETDLTSVSPRKQWLRFYIITESHMHEAMYSPRPKTQKKKKKKKKKKEREKHA